MNQLMHRLRTAPTFQYEGRRYVFFEKDNFQPIAGVVNITPFEQRFMCKTMVLVKGVTPCAYDGSSQDDRHLAATMDIARVLDACGDIVSFFELL